MSEGSIGGSRGSNPEPIGAATDWSALVLRPEQFFPDGARHLAGSVLIVLVLLLGAGSVVDRLEMNALGMARGRGAVAGSWIAYWTLVLGGSIVAGPVLYYVMGFWYWLRLHFSGATAPEIGLARRIQLLTTSIVTVPVVVLAVCETWRHPDPLSSWNGGDLLPATVLVLPFFSVFVSHRAATKSFELRPGPALVWFAILPAALYAVTMVGLAGLALGGTGMPG